MSYSRADAAWLKRLRVHLTPLERDGIISLWDDTRIKPGSKWRDEISEALNRATVAILLVSADFLASPFIRDNELPPLLSAAENRGTLILPVIVSACRFQQTKSLSCFQAVNSPDKPLRRLRPVERDEIFVRISDLIEHAFSSSRAQPPNDGHAHPRVITEQHKQGARTREEPLTAETISLWSDDDVMRYVADRATVQSQLLAPGVVVTLKDLFQSAVDSAVRIRLYELVHGCLRNGWLNWSGADQDQQVRLTVAGTQKVKEFISHDPAQLAVIVDSEHPVGTASNAQRRSDNHVVTANDIARWWSKDLFFYLVNELVSNQAPLNAGTVVSARKLFDLSLNTATKHWLYSLITMCTEAGWLSWKTYSEYELELTTGGAERARSVAVSLETGRDPNNGFLW